MPSLWKTWFGNVYFGPSGKRCGNVYFAAPMQNIAKRWILLQAMLRRPHFCEDVSSERAIFRHIVKYTKKSAWSLLEDVSSETLICVKSEVAKTSFL